MTRPMDSEWTPSARSGAGGISKRKGLSGVPIKIAADRPPIARPSPFPRPDIPIMATTTPVLESYQAQLVNDSLTAGALKFGSFTLKSGRCDQLMFAWDRAAPQFNGLPLESHRTSSTPA